MEEDFRKREMKFAKVPIFFSVFLRLQAASYGFIARSWKRRAFLPNDWSCTEVLTGKRWKAKEKK